MAILGLSVYALIMASLSLDTASFDSHLRGQLPQPWIIALFGTIVVSLAPVWMVMMIKAIQDGTPSLFTTIHVLDLAFVFPALIVAAAGLSRHQPWSHVLAGPLLILSATMMASLAISEIIAALRFTPDPLPLSSVFAMIALAATLLTGNYLRFLPSSPGQATSRPRNR